MTKKAYAFWKFVVAVIALAVLVGGCSREGGNPNAPSSTNPIQPPPDLSQYDSFYEPVNLSEDNIGLTLQFLKGTMSPPPGSIITPVPMNIPQNPCPERCLQFRAKVSFAALPANVSSNYAADVRLYFSTNGIRADSFFGTGYMNGITSTEFGNMGQVPFFKVPTLFIAEWNYRIPHLSTNGWVIEEKKGTKDLPTYYSTR